MPVIQNSVRSNSVTTNYLPDVSNINTSDYDLSQVNSYINNSIEQLSSALNDLQKNVCVLTVNKTATISASEAISFNQAIFDPFETSKKYTFVSPVSGTVQISVLLNLTRTSGSSTSVNLLVGADVVSVLYTTTATSFIVQSGIALKLNQGDVVRVSMTSSVQINQQSTYYNQFCARW